MYFDPQLLLLQTTHELFLARQRGKLLKKYAPSATYEAFTYQYNDGERLKAEDGRK